MAAAASITITIVVVNIIMLSLLADPGPESRAWCGCYHTQRPDHNDKNKTVRQSNNHSDRRQIDKTISSPHHQRATPQPQPNHLLCSPMYYMIYCFILALTRTIHGLSPKAYFKESEHEILDAGAAG